MNRLHCGNSIHALEGIQLRALRWRITGWLIVIELLLGQNILGRFLVVLQGASA